MSRFASVIEKSSFSLEGWMLASGVLFTITIFMISPVLQGDWRWGLKLIGVVWTLSGFFGSMGNLRRRH